MTTVGADRADPRGTVVVGTGQAAAQLAMSLRQRGYRAPITLLGEERHLPYQRPPLSKAYLAGEADADALPLRPAGFWTAKEVRVRTGSRAERLDRQARTVELDDGSRIPYRHLVLATGAQPRRPGVPGDAAAGVHLLRTRDDADRLRNAMAAADDVVVIGAGFIGLEVAAVARQRGCRVTVLEVQERAMARVVSACVAAHLAEEHRRRGVAVRLATGAERIEDDARGRARAVVTTDGAVLPCDLVVLGVGVAPRTELAEAAGLRCARGIVVDESLRTSDHDISAIGDCAAFPSPVNAGAPVRLEAVQNAADHARCVAARLTGAAHPYSAVPWFWTHQYDTRLQIAGLVDDHDTAVLRGEPKEGSFSNFCFAGGVLVGVESVNRPADHMLARSLLAGEHALTPEVVADPGVDLRTYKPSGAKRRIGARTPPPT